MNNTRINAKKKLPSFIVPKDIDVVVCSAGGVGTTFFINHINKYLNTNHVGDGDIFKHISFPPISYNSEIKYIYIFGNPIDSAISLFGRNYQRSHSRKLRNLGSSRKFIRKGVTLEQYAAERTDMFYFKEHFNSWLKLSKFHPTLFLRYEKIWENLETLYGFLGIPEDEIGLFPERRKRNSNFSALDKTTQENLIKMYGEFSKFLDQCGDYFIINEKRKSYFPGILFSESFYFTAKRAAGRKIYDISPDLFTRTGKVLNRLTKLK